MQREGRKEGEACHKASPVSGFGEGRSVTTRSNLPPPHLSRAERRQSDGVEEHRKEEDSGGCMNSGRNVLLMKEDALDTKTSRSASTSGVRV